MKYLIAIVIIYFVYRFFTKRQEQLKSRQEEKLDIGEYIDYEEIEEDQDGKYKDQ